MAKKLVLIGGGHAHMVTLANLHHFVERGYEVTVIQPSEYHYYSGMGPGMLSGTYHADDIRFATRQQVEAKGARFVLDKAERIEPHEQLVFLHGSGEVIPYDVLSCNAGSYVPQEMVIGDDRAVFTAKPIERLLVAQQQILELIATKSITIAVIGSGPSSIEIAGNLHQLCRDNGGVMPKIQLFGGRTFMSGKPARVRRLARAILERKGIEIIEAGYVQSVKGGQILLEDQQRYSADIIFPAVGVKPSPLFSESDLPTGQEGGLLVDAYLRSPRYPNIFGGGDCIDFEPEPLDKVGVYAVRQNTTLYHNLMASLEGGTLETFTPQGQYLLIYNLGDGEGILSKWFITFSGKLAFRIKDYIDRKFIQRFQE
jgi:NADH dehydrogenase FAD-containing subunit